MPVSPLQSWTREAERLETKKNLLYFKQLTGQKFDKKRLGALESRSRRHYTRYLEGHAKEAGASRGLFRLSATAVGTAVTYKQLVELHETRISKVVSKEVKFQGSPVNWGSWRQFASATEDSPARKRVFDDFLTKSSILAPLIRGRFEAYMAVLSKFNTDPLSVYLEQERISYARLVAMVQQLGELARGHFRASLEEFSSEILGRPAEYYDDFYFFRSRVFKRYAAGLPTSAQPLPKIVATMKRMGLDASRILVDDKDRKGKSSSAFCFSIKVPEDVRISYRKANPFDDFSSVFHEFGHGIHFSSIERDASFYDKYGVAMGVAEIFSIFFEGLVHEKLFLTDELDLPEEVAEDVLRRFRFNSLFFSAFYAANSTLKLRYWHDGLPFERLDGLYSDLTDRFLGIRYPGAYWKLHHVMPDNILYSPSYMIAAVRALELRNLLVGRFGDSYWKERGAGRAVLELMRPGQSIDLGFSKLDEAAYVQSLSAA